MKVVGPQPKYENLFEMDPLNMSRYPRKYNKLVYSLISFMLAFFAFALVFSLIYYMSPHSRNLRQYQREIYDWNKYHMAETFAGFTFSLSLGGNHTYPMQHKTHTNRAEIQGLQNVLKYQESYYRWNPRAEVKGFGVVSLDLSQAAGSKNGSEFMCMQLMGARKG